MPRGRDRKNDPMEEYVSENDIREANQRFDAQHPEFLRCRSRMASGWKEHRLLMGGTLTDKQVARYAAMGYYSTDLKAARRAYQQRKRWLRRL